MSKYSDLTQAQKDQHAELMKDAKQMGTTVIDSVTKKGEAVKLCKVTLSPDEWQAVKEMANER